MDTQRASQVSAALHGRWEPIYRSQLHYLVTWSTRGRRPVLKRRQIQTLCEILPPLCDERQITLIEIAAGQDHVHVLFGLRPSQSVATAVRELRSHAALTLLTRHPELRVWLGGHLVWDDRYAVETVSAGRVTKLRERLRALHADGESLARAS